MTRLKDQFEQLDIKLLVDYNKDHTTHVISKKRNTAKGLQALINGKYIVTESFLDAVLAAASPSQDETGAENQSALEEDFQANWPDMMQHLPPRGGEPVQHPNEMYAPDPGREQIFDGYTFIFYDQTQFNNLLAPIANGGGKAMYQEVKPDETEVDDFIRFVKGVAGEKGLGSFEDGSEGKGVVLVRHVPSKGAHVQWYANFFTSVSLRLDHRPIEQSEFLEAILIKDPSILRRPLEVEDSPVDNQGRPRRGPNGNGQEVSRPASNEPSVPEAEAEAEANSAQSSGAQLVARRGRSQRSVKRRFAGFDDGSDVEMDSIPAPPPPRAQVSTQAIEDESGLFVSQEVEQPSGPQESAQGSTQRKRSAPQEDDLMDGMAPAAARFKKQRIERGDNFASETPETEEQAESEAAAAPSVKKKIKKEIDILAVAAKNREQEEARAKAEKEDLAQLPEDIDLAEIRKLNIVEEMEVRQPAGAARSREQDIADGRWNPAWNGMKNFKKFRKRGEAQGRQALRTIVPLTEVKNKEFGVGDDYWLEDEDSQRRKKTQSQPSVLETDQSQGEPPTVAEPSARASRTSRVVESESDPGEEDDELESINELASRPARGQRRTATNTTSQSSSKQTSQSQKKRQAPEPTAKEQPPKRQRPTRKVMEIADSDDSDDDLKFRFGKRR
jgi:hypothetical protein